MGRNIVTCWLFNCRGDRVPTVVLDATVSSKLSAILTMSPIPESISVILNYPIRRITVEPSQQKGLTVQASTVWMEDCILTES